MISTLSSWISHWARQRPEAPAIVCNERNISWAQLRCNVNARAAQLAAAGAGRGERVACLLLNRVEYYEVFWACQLLGAIFVPLNTRLAAAELNEILGDADPRVFFSERADGLPQVPAVLAALGPAVARFIIDAAADVAPPAAEVEPVAASVDDPALILYTSGTTGLPKGAIITHGNVIASAHMWMTDFQLTGADRHLITLPLCFTGGLMAASMHVFCAGAQLVLMEAFDEGAALALLEKHRITWLIAVPQMLQRMRDDAAWSRTDLGALRGIQSGGSAVPVPLIEAYAERGVDLMQGFGLTEGTGGSNLYLAPEFAVTKAGSIGRAGFSNAVRVADETGRLCAADEVGELQLRGPLVFREYWRRVDATADSFTADGWLRTGDLASCDADGFHYIVGRKKDMIITGGLNVYPAEVERVLEKMPGIVEAAVIGVSDATWGETVVAVLRRAAGMEVDAAAVENWCRAALAGYKVPRRCEFVEDFPRTVSGKVLKRVLRELYA